MIRGLNSWSRPEMHDSFRRNNGTLFSNLR